MVREESEPPPLTEAAIFGRRAAQARAMAEKFTDHAVKEGLLNVAVTYDRLAESAEWHPAPRSETESD